MQKTTYGAVLLAVLISACGGEGAAVPPPQVPPPAPPPVVVAPPPPAPPAPTPEPPKPTTLEMQKQSLDAGLAAFNGHDAKKWSELFVADGVSNVIGAPEVKGREAIAAEAQKLFDAFPDFKIAPGALFAKGDVVVLEWVATGTQKGEFMGAKASNKAFGVKGATVFAFDADGHFKQERRYTDFGTVMSQIGAAKAPSRPVATPPTESAWHVAKGSPEEDKLVDAVKVMYGAFEKKSEADFLGSMSDTATWSDLSAPKDMSGKADAKKFFGMFTKAFPDGKMTADPFFAVDDFVVAEVTLNGTHAGQLGPLKPTKKPVTLHSVDILRVKDGKVVAGTEYSNMTEILAQEGLLPKPKPAKPEPKAAAEKPAAGDKKAADKPAADKPAADKKAADKSADKPAVDKKPAADKKPAPPKM